MKIFNNNDDHIKVITDETHGCLKVNDMKIEHKLILR